MEHLGGFHSFEIIKIADIISIPEIITNSNINQFSYSITGNNNTIIEPVGETLLVSSKPKRTTQGLRYHISASLEIKAPSSETDTLFDDYRKEEILLKANLYDGQSILYGSKVHPLELTYHDKHSKLQENPFKTIISIKGKIPQKPIYFRSR
ncbi:hypothetical protein SAMN04489761_3048 [Tenacibaculum sp. MAR_2009_124]|uniref:hypothetical protein n=1 Tax=Tenacibaculum sp. MAR_2009_124 TaxID=1250059 RepID=UPI000897E954|nr:hypothetical protein [Tenacibaculum sp. MAR_2009_124]SEC45779.1 hypothetical protein SAMN04489761_3048 [Tenacibaculum sp. MAR_2009_124]